MMSEQYRPYPCGDIVVDLAQAIINRGFHHESVRVRHVEPPGSQQIEVTLSDITFDYARIIVDTQWLIESAGTSDYLKALNIAADDVTNDRKVKRHFGIDEPDQTKSETSL